MWPIPPVAWKCTTALCQNPSIADLAEHAGYSVLGPAFDAHPIVDGIHGAVEVVRWMQYESMWENGWITNQKLRQMSKDILTMFVFVAASEYIHATPYLWRNPFRQE